MGLFEDGSAKSRAPNRRYAGTADARITESLRVNVPLGQREPTDGMLVRVPDGPMRRGAEAVPVEGLEGAHAHQACAP